MPGFRLLKLARTDLGGIARHTQLEWGETQARKYIRELEECFELLAANPKLGRLPDGDKYGTRRMQQGSHVVFYRSEDGGIVIRRVLHYKMLPAARLR